EIDSPDETNIQRIVGIDRGLRQILTIADDTTHTTFYSGKSLMKKRRASSIVKTLKGKSARLWFKAYPETKAMLWGGHLWTPSYFMATVGSMSKE
ncbi:UNVERIFIED_CONTAM: transposase, partial [Aerococcus urinaeequi]